MADADSPDRLDEDRARAVWLRAAQLQAEAARRLEERSRQLAAGEVEGEPDEGPGLRVADVRAAAEEAGIAPEFVELALAEAQSQLDDRKALTGWKARSAARLLGTEQQILEVTRTVSAAPSRVLEVMRELLPKHPYFLTLRDTVGDDPLNGAILVFEVPGMMGTTYTSFMYAMQWSDLKELRFMLRPVDDGARTEVRVTIPLAGGRRTNWMVGTGMSGLTGFVGGLFGAVGAKILALTGALVVAPIAVGAVGVAAAGSAGYGAVYRAGLRKGEREVVTLLKTLDVSCRMGTGFRSEPPPPSSSDGLEGLLGS